MLFSILENRLIGYANDSTLMAVLTSPGVIVTVAESLIRDLGRVSEEYPTEYRKTFMPLSVSIWNDLTDPVFCGVGLAGFKSRANALLLA